MAVSWTKEQQKVIDLRSRNILVSAAAGSGKTAVLVERIITMISDRNHPVDIDKLLIVTFTNAAAAEMRERIRAAIEKKLDDEPDNVHLQRQVTLIHNAQITTIHSFCLYVIRNNFNAIDLDPSFRIGDEGELKLLKTDVVKDLLEKSFESKQENFFHFIECYSTGKSDKKIEELILQLYDFSMSYPWPGIWLEDCKKDYAVSSFSELENKKWMQQLKTSVTLYLEDLINVTNRAISTALVQGGPYMYEEALQSDKLLLQRLMNCATYDEYHQAFHEISYTRLSVKKDKSVSDQMRDIIKGLREQVKKSLKSLKEQYFYASSEVILEDMKNSRQQIEVLVDLSLAFAKIYKEKKAEKNLVDFNDLEHFALNILVELKEDNAVATGVASELSDSFEEIMIDEYQDSNLVQEIILNSISKIPGGTYNIFMVGDVKQSIYRFRLARPELFMEKYETYSLKDSLCQRIDLHKNFRSRGQVLDGINFIFHQIMAQYLGNVQYDNNTALYEGAVFKEGNKPDFSNTEVLLIDVESLPHMRSVESVGTEILEEKEPEETERELEAKCIAKRIHEIVGKELVLDKKTGEYRQARYKDIVILLRTINGWADTFTSVLAGQGIPAYSTSQTGYFSAIEIQNILNMLRLMDNPRQDIPMAAVLKSPICHFSGDEMAVIKSSYKGERFYRACYLYGEQGEDKKLRDKLRSFFFMLENFRSKVPYTPMHELIWFILEQTGYGNYIWAQKGGKQRKANVDMLVEKAISFEASSYKGLFNFIRYIENLRKYDVDFGEASVIGENEDTVRIMSIHKSKGLEFPIVFASGMGKSFNNQDSKSKLVLHSDFGIGVDFIDPYLRVKTPTILKKVIQKQTTLENLGEELRVLYVAFTRAKEKLIITGTMKKIRNKLEKWIYLCGQEEKKLPFYHLSGATSYWDWVVPSLMRHKSFTDVLEMYELESNIENGLYDAAVSFDVKVIKLQELVEDEITRQVGSHVTKEMLLNWNPEILYAKDTRILLKKQLNEIYPYEKERDIVTKVTVSELKKRGQHIDEDYSKRIYEEPEIIPFTPVFMRAEESMSAAVRGTAYHKMLECIDFTKAVSKQKTAELIEELVAKSKITRETADVVDPYKIFLFGKSDLAVRMNEAKEKGQLFREQQFVIGTSASRVKKEWSKDELVLVQGIIDVFFYEGEDIILADYKTDYIKDGEEDKLRNRYKVQLDYYTEAVERVTGKKVKEKIIYSFALNREIVL